jgi:hypothetical protein
MLQVLVHEQPILCAAAENLVLVPCLLNDPIRGQLHQRTLGGRKLCWPTLHGENLRRRRLMLSVLLQRPRRTVGHFPPLTLISPSCYDCVDFHFARTVLHTFARVFVLYFTFSGLHYACLHFPPSSGHSARLRALVDLFIAN